MSWMMKWGYQDIHALIGWSAVDRKSEKHISVALGTTDVEYIAVSVAGREVVWLQESSYRTSLETWCRREQCGSSTYPQMRKLHQASIQTEVCILRGQVWCDGECIPR